MTEISFIISWEIWLPIIISGVSLFLSLRSIKKKSNRDEIVDVELRIDQAYQALQNCEEKLRACGREKDELRREKYALLERLSNLNRNGRFNDK